MRSKLVVLFILFSITNCYSQKILNIIVQDSITKEPLPFATLYLKDIGKGTTTNFEGKAVFTISNKTVLKDTVVCSYIGYNKKSIPFDLLQKYVVTIELSSSTTKLNEVEIVYKKPLSVKKILKKTIKNTTKNYSQDAVNFQALYRELMQENDKYIYLNEAVVDIHYTKYPQNNIDRKTYHKWMYDDSYAFEFNYSKFNGFPTQFNTREDKVKIIESRSSESSSVNNLDIPISGHPLSLTAKDYIKYRNDFLNPKTINNYTYTKKESESINGTDCYVIQFHPKSSSKKVVFNYIFKNKNAIYTGRMYIDKTTFALVKMDFQLLQSFDYGFYKYHVPLDSKITVEYKKFESKWYLNKISLQQTRKVYIQKTKKYSLVNSYQELFITKIDNENAHKITNLNEWKHTRLTQLRNYKRIYNSTFWNNYTLYPKLSKKIKNDLKQNVSLEKQFNNRFKQKENLPIPYANKEKTIFNYPSESLTDYYHWFSNPEKRKSFYNYLEKENEYAKNYLIPYRKTQKRLFNNLNNFYPTDTSKIAVKHKKGNLTTELDSLEDLHIYEYSDSVTKQSIFNYNAFKTKRINCYITSGIKVNKNNLAINYTVNGNKNNNLIIQPKGSEVILDSISEVYSFEWFNDSLLLYTKNNKTKRSDKLYCRNVYTHSDSLLMFEKDLTFDISIQKTKSNFICTIQSMNENEILIALKGEIYPIFSLSLAREENIYHELKEFNNKMYVLTNKNAPNNKVSLLEKNVLNDIVKMKENTQIIDFLFTDNFMVIKTLKNSFIEVLYKNKNEKKWKRINFSSEVFYVSFNKKENDNINLYYSNPKTPYTKYNFDLTTNKLTKIKETKVKYKYRNYLKSINIKREWVKSKDGIKIPITIIKGGYSVKNHKGLILKAYGMYGAFGQGYNFNKEDVSLLNEGYTIVYAHVRGGGELGKKWHLDGKLLNKENTFNDYISCAEYLIKKKYTTPDYLVGYGNSAGGLLMGVVINRRPELFNTVILDHPYLDALTTMMMDTLPLTTDHYKEVGNPKEKIFYDYMKSYSPYQNIKKQDYPNLLFIASSNDYQTPTWQIAKYVAKVREFNTSTNTILFTTDFGSGHTGSTQGNQRLKGMSFKNAYIYMNLFE